MLLLNLFPLPTSDEEKGTTSDRGQGKNTDDNSCGDTSDIRSALLRLFCRGDDCGSGLGLTWRGYNDSTGVSYDRWSRIFDWRSL